MIPTIEAMDPEFEAAKQRLREYVKAYPDQAMIAIYGLYL
jgi:hypothetical protein